MRAEIDHWNANRCSEEIIEVHTTTEIMELINRLDGQRHTLLNIVTNDNAFMIGGGPNQFIAVRQSGDGSSMSLSNGLSGQMSGKVYLCVGGQEGDYDPQIVLEKMLVESLVDDIISGKDDSAKVWLPD